MVRGMPNRRSNSASVNFGVASPVQQKYSRSSGFFSYRGRGLVYALAGSSCERDGCACCARRASSMIAEPAIRAMAATSLRYSASSFAMNAAMSSEFIAMRHGGCVALILSSMWSQRGDHVRMSLKHHPNRWRGSSST
jgi:hypothetical protein